jgi:hypothetical protein
MAFAVGQLVQHADLAASEDNLDRIREDSSVNVRRGWRARSQRVCSCLSDFLHEALGSY